MQKLVELRGPGPGRKVAGRLRAEPLTYGLAEAMQARRRDLGAHIDVEQLVQVRGGHLVAGVA